MVRQIDVLWWQYVMLLLAIAIVASDGVDDV